MSKIKWKVALVVAAGVAAIGADASRAVAQTGRFLAILNEQGSNGDSRRSVTYFDADDLANGPMFSVFIGYELAGNFEEMSAIDVNPATGDVYVLGFDSGTMQIPEPTAPTLDTQGDFDLYKIDFDSVFSHWSTNFKGQDVRTLGGSLAVGDSLPGGSKNSLNLDYVTYGGENPFDANFDFDATHSNTFTLPGVVQKLGEVKRNSGGGGFFPISLEFLDEETLFFLDDSSDLTAVDTAATDHEYRVLERVSTTPGMADDAGADFLDGGFNLGTTESWNSRRIGKVGLDFAEGLPVGHSEPESTAYYVDPVSGVRGVWVTESEGATGGDDIAFLELDSSNNVVGYRPYTTGSSSFALDDNPFVDANTNNGKADNIFVDSDTGDLIILESGFGDAVPHEPAVIRREVISYDNGSGEIQFGAWSEKIILNPMKTPGEDTAFLERGQWSAYDSVNDLVFMFNPGNGAPENPQFEMDLWVIDLKTGVTESFLDLDESVSMFQSDSFGDKVAFFSLGGETVADADFNQDGSIDGSDFLVWQRGFGSGSTLMQGDANGDTVVDAADLAIWKSQFASASTAAVGAVPEPAAVTMGLICCSVLAAATRRRRVA